MTTAHFQPLTWVAWFRLTGWMVGIIRVYAPGMRYPTSPYKFFTVAMLQGGLATIYGMRDSHIGIGDLRAMEVALKVFSVKLATWTHDGKTHFYKLR